ncbi:MAG: P27 family phage terminase small subunit [Gemmatimonadota bacterium]
MAEVLPIRPRAVPSQVVGPVETPDPPAPPSSLRGEGAELWRSIVDQWVLGPDGLPLLRAACETWDRYREAEVVLREEGPTVLNPDSGLTCIHPAHQVARDNLREFRQLFRQLHLEVPSEVVP